MKTAVVVVVIAALAISSHAAQQSGAGATRPDLEPPVVSAELLSFRTRPLLGITAEQLSGQSTLNAGVRGDEIVRIAEVHPSSAAQRAGLAAGDLILEADGDPIFTIPEFRTRLWEKRHAREITLEVLRGGMEVSIDVDLIGVRRTPPPLSSDQL
jgi:S1-C subfamily serine protease